MVLVYLSTFTPHSAAQIQITIAAPWREQERALGRENGK